MISVAHRQAALTWEAAESLRAEWQVLCRHPNADPDYVQLICGNRPAIAGPCVVRVAGGTGQQAGLAVGRHERTSAELRLGYLTVLRLRFRSLTVVHGGVLGDDTDEIAGEMLEELLNELDKAKADVITLSHLRRGSALHRAVERRVSNRYCTATRMYWRLRLPGSFEELLGGLSAKHRRNIRRTVKKWESKYGAALEMRCYQRLADLPVIVADVERIARKTYQRGLGAGFSDNAETRQRLHLEAEKEWLRMFVLYARQTPVAYWWGQSYKDWFFSAALGYDPAYAEDSPGTYLMVKALEEIHRQGHNTVDFGLGDALYKRQFQTEGFEEGTVYVFAPTVRGRVLRWAVSAADSMDAWAKAAAARLGVLEKAKASWRSRLRRPGGR